MSDQEWAEAEQQRATFVMESGILEHMEQASREPDPERFRSLVSEGWRSSRRNGIWTEKGETRATSIRVLTVAQNRK